MLLTFLSRTMSSLLTTLLFISVVGFTANQTILNTNYIETKLQSQDAYDRLSDALSQKISQDSHDPTISKTAVAAQLKTVLTPDVLHQKIDTTLKQLNDYFHNNGKVPTLDVSDLMQAAQQAGLEIDDNTFAKPVQLTTVKNIKKVSDGAKFVGIGMIVAEALLFLGVLAIAIKRRDYRPLANIIFVLGIMLTIAGTVLLFAPQVLSKALHFDPTKDAFNSLAHDLAVVATHDFGLRLLIPGVTALLLGILAKYALRGHKPRATKQNVVKSDDTLPAASTPEPSSATDATPATVAEAPTASAPTTNPNAAAGQVPGAPPRPKKPRKIQL